MKFAAVIDYVPDADLAAKHRPDHRKYTAELKARGQLAASGPFNDGSGALIIYETDSVEAAEQLLRADPFHQAGVFARWSLRPWTVAHVNLQLFPQSP